MNSAKITLRHLWKNKLFTALNIIGLAIGISACWMVFTIVQHELSFDKKVPDAAYINQIISMDNEKGVDKGFPGVPLGLAQLMVDQALPDALVVPIYNQNVERISVASEKEGPAVNYENPEKIIGTLKSYFDLLPYEWVAGNAKSAFSNTHQVVLTTSRAKQYFPKENPEELLGKTITLDSTLYQISGLVKDLPFQSSFQAEVFIPISDADWSTHNWMGMNSNHNVYIKTKNQASLDRLLQVVQNEYNNTAAAEHAKYGAPIKFVPFPLTKKHFEPQYNSYGMAANMKVLYGLMAIGGFLLLLACINYINLSTAQVPQRAKEIGIRKTLGAKPAAITRDFLLETLLISLLALLLSWPITTLFQHFYPEFIPENLQRYSQPTLLIGFLLLLVTLISLLSGLYPAYLINKVRAIETLKGKLDTKIKGTRLNLRKTLIVFQFVIAQFFIVCALIMGKQLDFTISSDLGFEHEAVVNVQMPYKFYHDAEVNPFLYKEALKKHPEIAAVALGHEPLNSSYWGSVYYLANDTGKIQIQLPRKYIDEDYLDLYKIKLLAGKNLLRTENENGVLINESTLQELGLKTPEEAVGKSLIAYDKSLVPIIGVFKDFNQRSLREKIAPLMLMSSSKRGQLQLFNIKLSQDRKQWAEAIAILEKEWKNFYPNTPFDYKFNDERMKSIYENEQRTAKLINLATMVTILISCFGLFGLSTLTASQRTKEIGIRKVLGASASRIVAMLSKDFAQLILVAVIIASPVAWWAMNKWLENFVYRIDIEWWIFLTAGFLALLIAFFTIGYQATKAALLNPIKSLRDE